MRPLFLACRALLARLIKIKSSPSNNSQQRGAFLSDGPLPVPIEYARVEFQLRFEPSLREGPTSIRPLDSSCRYLTGFR